MPIQDEPRDDRPGKGEQAPEAAGEANGGNSLKDASDEMVRFLEDTDEPGHAGRGDYG